MSAEERARARFRLVLGRFAEERLPGALAADARLVRVDRALDYLYGREYVPRGIRAPGGSGVRREGTLIDVPGWLREVRELFPREVCDVVTKHALERYELSEIVTDPQVLARLEPSYDLLKAVLTFRHMMHGPVLDVARILVRKVADDLARRLAAELQPALSARSGRSAATRRKQPRGLDGKRTLRASLRHYDPDARRLMAAELVFLARRRQRLRWEIILCVDCSASMLDSVIHAAVMAGIFHALPSVRTKLIAFDTRVADLSERVHDPVELLMSVQLGGGTDIAGALSYCADLIEQPTRTIVIVVSDFFEGGDPHLLLSQIKRLTGAGARVWGLTALDAQAQPVYDRDLAAACAQVGADVAAVTPGRLAEWIAATLR